MTLDEATEAAPRKSGWRAADGKRWTVIGHKLAGDVVEVLFSMTNDARVKASRPADQFLGEFTRVP